MNLPVSNTAASAPPADTLPGLLAALRLDALELRQMEVGSRLAALEGLVFSLRRELAELRGAQPHVADSSPGIFRVIAVRVAGDRLVINDHVDLEQARGLRDRLLATSTFADILIEPIGRPAGFDTGEGAFLDTIDQ